jgi:hypothetical protein
LRISRAISNRPQPPADGRIGKATIAQRRKLEVAEESGKYDESVALEQRNFARLEWPS